MEMFIELRVDGNSNDSSRELITAKVQNTVMYFYTFYVNNRKAKATIKLIYRARQKSSRAASVVLLHIFI